MSTYNYYYSEADVDLLYKLPFFFRKIEMSTTTFNNMFGRPTLGRPSTVTLELVDEEDIWAMKKYTSSFDEGIVHVPYPNILGDLIENGQYELLDDDSFIVP